MITDGARPTAAPASAVRPVPRWRRAGEFVGLGPWIPTRTSRGGRRGRDWRSLRARSRPHLTDSATRLHTNASSEHREPSALESLHCNRIALLGCIGAFLIAIGGLGAGAQPVLQNPISGVRVLGLLSRAPSSSFTICIIGAVLMMFSWLLLGRYAVGPLRGAHIITKITQRQLAKIFLMWTLPFLLTPPLFSQDVYSYLAQSEITARGMDPFTLGPAPALGVDHVFTRSVPTIWRDSPAPYGPLFLWIGSLAYKITGENVVAAVTAHRLIAVAGVALIVWALPRLARRGGVPPVAALWLGALNPLLIFHLIGGIHNEALMLGLMLTGLEFTLSGITQARKAAQRATQGAAGVGLAGLGMVALGAATMAAGAMIKFTAILAFGFAGMALAHELATGRVWPPRSGRRRSRIEAIVLAATGLGAVLAAFTLPLCLSTGLGFGWLDTLSVTKIRSWMSLPTQAGVMTSNAGSAMGLGDHSDAILDITRPIAGVAAGLIVLRMLWATFTGRFPPVGALGVSFGAIVLLFPVVQPWYLLWAALPLAAWASSGPFRVAAATISCIACVLLLPGGHNVAPYLIQQAILVSVPAVAIISAIALHRPLRWHRTRPIAAEAPTPRQPATASE